MTQPNEGRSVDEHYPPPLPDDLPDERDQIARGPLLTPLRVFLGIALIASSGVVVYGLVARDTTQMPMLTAGEFMSGVVFLLLALAGAWAAFSRARDGESGRALLYALLGGICILVAAGSFAAAIILALTLQKAG